MKNNSNHTEKIYWVLIDFISFCFLGVSQVILTEKYSLKYCWLGFK
ncbi:MAG: hypothetical protein ABIA04_13200 [Pseudomonadota bacterium]